MRSPERNECIRRMRKEGMTYCQIADAFGISWQRVQQIDMEEQHNERRVLKKHSTKVNANPNAPLTISEIVIYAKEHGLQNSYGKAVIMMEAERGKRNDR